VNQKPNWSVFRPVGFTQHKMKGGNALNGVGVVGKNLCTGFQYSLIRPKITNIDLGGIRKFADADGFHIQLPSATVEGSFAVVGAITSVDQLTAQQIVCPHGFDGQKSRVKNG